MKKIFTCFLSAVLVFTNAFALGNIKSVWANVPVTRGDEDYSPYKSADGKRIAKITADYGEKSDGEVKSVAAVFGADGTLKSISSDLLKAENGRYTGTYDVEISETEDETVKFFCLDKDTLTPSAKAETYAKSDFYSLTQYSVLNDTDDYKYRTHVSFENGIPGMILPKNDGIFAVTDEVSANSGSKVMKVSGKQKDSDSWIIEAENIDQNTKTLNFSCYVRLPEDKTKPINFQVEAFVPFNSTDGTITKMKCIKPKANGTNTEWVSVKNNVWTKIYVTLDLAGFDLSQPNDATYKNVFFGLRNGSDTNVSPTVANRTDFYVDDITLTADTYGRYFDDSIDMPVDEISDKTKLGYRFAFENVSVDNLTAANTAEYAISTDTAHTGARSLKVYNRTSDTGTAAVTFSNPPSDMTSLDFSCYLRLDDSKTQNVNFWIEACVPYYLKDGTAKASYFNVNPEGKTSPYVSISKDGWTRINGTLDLSAYDFANPKDSANKKIFIRIRNGTDRNDGKNNKCDYYIDDFYAVSNVSGAFLDDMDYVNPKIPDTVSKTAYKTMPIETEPQNIPNLKDVYKDYFKIGACIWSGAESNTSKFGKLIKKHFNSLVNDGIMKMPSILKIQNDGTLDYDYTDVDKFMDWASGNGFDDVVGHTFFWETLSWCSYSLKNPSNTLSENADDYKNRESLLAFMKEYITNVMKHCEGDGGADEYVHNGTSYNPENWHISAWDVVNEAVWGMTAPTPESGNKDKISYAHVKGNNPYYAYYDLIGADYIKYAFKYASECKTANNYTTDLRYNDYDLYCENKQYADYFNAKADGVYYLIRGLLDEGIEVNTVGFQSHYYSNYADGVNVKFYNPANTTRFYTFDDFLEHTEYLLDKWISLGLDLNITELDIQAMSRLEGNAKLNLYANGITKSAEKNQTRMYAELFKRYKERKDSITRVTFWSPTDKHQYYDLRNESVEYPGIFDRNCEAKPMYWAIINPEEYLKDPDGNYEKISDGTYPLMTSGN